MDVQVQGGKPKGIPQNKNRAAGLNVGINGKKSAGSFQLKAKDLIKFDTTGDNFEVLTKKDVNITATEKVEISATDDLTLNATNGKIDAKGSSVAIESTTGKVEVKAAGDFKVTALKIYLN